MWSGWSNTLLSGALILLNEIPFPAHSHVTQNEACTHHTATSLTDTGSIQELRTQIERCLRSAGIIFEVRQDGDIRVREGTTFVTLRIAEWSAFLVVRIFAPLVVHMTAVTPELTRHLLALNYQRRYSKFSLDEGNGSVWCEYSLLADYLDEDELTLTISAIAQSADAEKAVVAKMAGGQPFTNL